MKRCGEYSLDRKYGFRFALEAKPNEPSGRHLYGGDRPYLGFIRTRPPSGRRNPEVRTGRMEGLNSSTHVAKAWKPASCFTRLGGNDKVRRYDQDSVLSRERESPSGCEILEDVGSLARAFRRACLPHRRYFSTRRGLRTVGCMRIVLDLKERAGQLNADRLKDWSRRIRKTRGNAASGYERLDQLDAGSAARVR